MLEYTIWKTSYTPNFYFDSCCAMLGLIIIQQVVHSRTPVLHTGLCVVASTLQGTVILKGLKVYQHGHVK